MLLHQMLPSVNITWWESPEAVGAVCAGQVRFAFSHKWASICFEFEEHHWAHFGLWEMLVRGEDGCSNWNIPALTQSLQRLVKSKPYSWATCGLSTDEIVQLCYHWGGGGGIAITAWEDVGFISICSLHISTHIVIVAVSVCTFWIWVCLVLVYISLCYYQSMLSILLHFSALSVQFLTFWVSDLLYAVCVLIMFSHSVLYLCISTHCSVCVMCILRSHIIL